MQLQYLDQWHQLEDCEVIEGNLVVTTGIMETSVQPEMIQNFNMSFPKLREITDYLLVYRAELLRKLTPLFPNLAVIRGNELLEVRNSKI